MKIILSKYEKKVKKMVSNKPVLFALSTIITIIAHLINTEVMSIVTDSATTIGILLLVIDKSEEV